VLEDHLDLVEQELFLAGADRVEDRLVLRGTARERRQGDVRERR
jgi:hypothetical protein